MFEIDKAYTITFRDENGYLTGVEGVNQLDVICRSVEGTLVKLEPIVPARSTASAGAEDIFSEDGTGQDNKPFEIIFNTSSCDFQYAIEYSGPRQ